MSLSRLPPEILDNVCSRLEPMHLKSLRLVSHQLSHSASQYMLETVYVDLLPESFERLLAIAAHQIFSRTVRRLFYQPVCFVPSGSLQLYKTYCSNGFEKHQLRKLLGVDVSSSKDLGLSNEDWKKRYSRFQYHRRRQKTFVQSLRVIAAMRKAVTSFPKLETVLVAKFPCGNIGSLVQCRG